MLFKSFDYYLLLEGVIPDKPVCRDPNGFKLSYNQRQLLELILNRLLINQPDGKFSDTGFRDLAQQVLGLPATATSATVGGITYTSTDTSFRRGQEPWQNEDYIEYYIQQHAQDKANTSVLDRPMAKQAIIADWKSQKSRLPGVLGYMVRQQKTNQLLSNLGDKIIRLPGDTTQYRLSNKVLQYVITDVTGFHRLDCEHPQLCCLNAPQKTTSTTATTALSPKSSGAKTVTSPTINYDCRNSSHQIILDRATKPALEYILNYVISSDSKPERQLFTLPQTIIDQKFINNMSKRPTSQRLLDHNNGPMLIARGGDQYMLDSRLIRAIKFSEVYQLWYLQCSVGQDRYNCLQCRKMVNNKGPEQIIIDFKFN